MIEHAKVWDSFNLVCANTANQHFFGAASPIHHPPSTNIHRPIHRPSASRLVVLDGDSAEDEHACALLPSWSRCSLQPKPSFLAKFTKPFSHIDPFGVAGKGR